LESLVPFLFAFTMFLSATLLFMVQPMIGKMVLPYVGGSPAVWNTCMVFFQSLLLLGYLYAHKLASQPNQKAQVKIHLGVLAASAAVMGLAAVLTADGATVPVVKSLAPSGGGFPFFEVLAMLAIAIAVPFFAVSTSAPLLQRWFAVTGHPSAKDPYFLYAASNAGSLISLLGYPLLLEPSLRVVHQTWLWAGGFVFLVVATWLCGRASLNPVLPAARPGGPAPADTLGTGKPSGRQKWFWLMRAFIPSSLMLGVTTFMTTDIASVPLLWVIPLALYLLTFIIAFAQMPWWYRPFIANAAPVVVLLLVFVLISGVLDRDRDEVGVSPMLLKLSLHLSAYFLLSLLMHSELAHERPAAKHLTGYFLWISLGGVCGGLFNALIAPLVFTHPYEYPIAIALGCMLVPVLDAVKPDSELTEAEKVSRGWATMFDFLIPAIMVAFIALMLWASNRDFFNSACRMIVEQLRLGMATVKPFIVFAPLCLICFLFIDRPLRFGLCVFAILGVNEYRTSNAESTSQTLRSYFGIVRIDRNPESFASAYASMLKPSDVGPWAAYEVADITSMSHGTTLHGKQFRSRFRVTGDAKTIREFLEDPKANREELNRRTTDAGLPPALTDDLRLLTVFDPWQAATLIGARNAWDPTQDPLTYYHRTGPVGLIMSEAFRRKPLPEIGMVGLGTGSVAAYAQPGQTFNFYEIDSKVRDMILQEKDAPFTYVQNAKSRGAKIEMIMGDARLMLERDPAERKYDLLLIDAFSSDAIPVHLLTVESLKLYQQRLKPGGLFAMHISNVYLRLEPVVAAIAKQNGLACRVLNDRDQNHPGKTASSWVILAENEETLGKAFTDPDEVPGTFAKPDWRPLEYQPMVKPWTDDYQDMLMVLGIKEVQALRRWFGLPVLPPQ
jgi:hypothetical protein